MNTSITTFITFLVTVLVTVLAMMARCIKAQRTAIRIAPMRKAPDPLRYLRSRSSRAVGLSVRR